MYRTASLSSQPITKLISRKCAHFVAPSNAKNRDRYSVPIDSNSSRGQALFVRFANFIAGTSPQLQKFSPSFQYAIHVGLIGYKFSRRNLLVKFYLSRGRIFMGTRHSILLLR